MSADYRLGLAAGLRLGARHLRQRPGPFVTWYRRVRGHRHDGTAVGVPYEYRLLVAGYLENLANDEGVIGAENGGVA